MKVLLVDADSLCYAACFAHQTTVYEVPALSAVFDTKKEAISEYVEHCEVLEGEDVRECMFPIVTTDPISHTLVTINQMIASQAERARKALGWSTEDTEVRLYLTGKGNFRESLVDNYKANRDKLAKPLQLKDVRKYLLEYKDAILCEGYEADDAVSAELIIDPMNRCIVGIDKDLWNTPGWHFNPKKDDKEALELVTEYSAMRHFLVQLIQGDTVDNIQGIKKFSPELQQEFGLSYHCLRGIGPAAAESIYLKLEESSSSPVEIYDKIAELYDTVRGTVFPAQTDCETNAKLLWMTRELVENEPVQFHLGLLPNEDLRPADT